MATVKKSIKINAPVEKVFEYLTPENLPEIWPSLVEVKNVKNYPTEAIVGIGCTRWLVCALLVLTST